jgi:hypothetical protein
MSWFSKFGGRTAEPLNMEPPEMDALDPAVKQALKDFKSSVHAWSEAKYGRERTVEQAVARRSWRLAAGWGFAVVLLVGTLSGGMYAFHERQIEAQAAAALEAEHQRELAAQREIDEAKQVDDALASVDSDVSREVPSAMEPLVQLTKESATKSK